MRPSLPAFRDELVKIAIAVTVGPKARAENKALAFQQAEKKDWAKFERDLKSRRFQSAVKAGTDDAKLQAYVDNYGAYLTSKKVVTTVPSRTDPTKKYKVKRLPGGRLACGCRDWQYKRSVDGTDCVHIRGLNEG